VEGCKTLGRALLTTCPAIRGETPRRQEDPQTTAVAFVVSQGDGHEIGNAYQNCIRLFRGDAAYGNPRDYHKLLFANSGWHERRSRR